MQAEAVVTAPRIDEEVLCDTIRLGFDRESVIESVRSRAQNKATVAYFLMVDNRRRAVSSGYLRSELETSSMASGGGANLPPPPGGYLGGYGHVIPPGSAPAGGITNQRVHAERRWRLGLHSRGHPSSLMAELYRVLQLLGIVWKKISPYNLKCRKAMRTRRVSVANDDSLDHQMDEIAAKPAGVEGEGESILKFEIQMYKAKDDEYLIDLQVGAAPTPLPPLSPDLTPRPHPNPCNMSRRGWQGIRFHSSSSPARS